MSADDLDGYREAACLVAWWAAVGREVAAANPAAVRWLLVRAVDWRAEP